MASLMTAQFHPVHLQLLFPSVNFVGQALCATILLLHRPRHKFLNIHLGDDLKGHDNFAIVSQSELWDIIAESRNSVAEGNV
jgi:hypothetical protein